MIHAAQALGTYTVVLGDASGGLLGSGTYVLTAEGVSQGNYLCIPVVNGTNLVLRAVGGVPGGGYVLLTAPVVDLPGPSWEPIWTNQFGPLGEFRVTNYFDIAVPQAYFRFRKPE